jgi:hypothetical protein
MNESNKKLFERVGYLVFFVLGLSAVHAYEAKHATPPPAAPAANVDDPEQARRKEELRKALAEFDAKQAAGHGARVKRLGEAGAKAQEDRCDDELMAAFQSVVDQEPLPKTPDCDE